MISATMKWAGEGCTSQEYMSAEDEITRMHLTEIIKSPKTPTD